MDMGAMRFAFGRVETRSCGVDSEYSFLFYIDVEEHNLQFTIREKIFQYVFITFTFLSSTVLEIGPSTSCTLSENPACGRDSQSLTPKHD